MRRPLVVDTGFNFCCTTLASAVNYASIILAGRLLTKPQFGRSNSLLALITLVSMNATSMQMQITKSISHLKANAQAADHAEEYSNYLDQICGRTMVMLWLPRCCLLSPSAPRQNGRSSFDLSLPSLHGLGGVG